MKELRVDVFGREIAVKATAEGWKETFVSGEGKSRPADFPIPADLNEEEILAYLDDLFHESASADNPNVQQL